MPSRADRDRLLRLREVSEALAVGAATVRRLIARSDLAAINVSTNPDRKVYRVHPDALDDYMQRAAVRTETAPTYARTRNSQRRAS